MEQSYYGTIKILCSSFYRKGDKIEFSGITAKQQENIFISLENETLIVSLGAKLKISL